MQLESRRKKELPAIIGNTARGASQAKPVNTATAIIDDERGPFLIGHVCNQRRELTSGSRVHQVTRKIVEILPKASLDDAEHVYIVEPSIAHPRETQLRNSTVFCAPQPGHLSLHNNRRVTTMPEYGLLHSVHCAYQDLHAAGMSTLLLMN